MAPPSDTPKHRLWAPDNAEYMDVPVERCEARKRCGGSPDKPEHEQHRERFPASFEAIRYAIDKNCTGGRPEDWDAADQALADILREGELQPASPRQGEAEGEGIEEAAEYVARRLTTATVGWLTSVLRNEDRATHKELQVKLVDLGDRLRSALARSSEAHSVGEAEGERDSAILGDERHPDQREYMAANILAHIEKMPQTGDWWWQLKQWAEANRSDRIQANAEAHSVGEDDPRERYREALERTAAELEKRAEAHRLSEDDPESFNRDYDAGLAAASQTAADELRAMARSALSPHPRDTDGSDG